VTEANHSWKCWGLRKRENGDVYDMSGSYGEKGVVYGRIVDGVAVPVAVPVAEVQGANAVQGGIAVQGGDEVQGGNAVQGGGDGESEGEDGGESESDSYLV